MSPKPESPTPVLRFSLLLSAILMMICSGMLAKPRWHGQYCWHVADPQGAFFGPR
jgi:hypothetical protein